MQLAPRVPPADPGPKGQRRCAPGSAGICPKDPGPKGQRRCALAARAAANCAPAAHWSAMELGSPIAASARDLDLSCGGCLTLHLPLPPCSPAEAPAAATTAEPPAAATTAGCPVVTRGAGTRAGAWACSCLPSPNPASYSLCALRSPLTLQSCTASSRHGVCTSVRFVAPAGYIPIHAGHRGRVVGWRRSCGPTYRVNELDLCSAPTTPLYALLAPSLPTRTPPYAVTRCERCEPACRWWSRGRVRCGWLVSSHRCAASRLR